MRLTDIGYQDIARPCGQDGSIGSEELPLSFEDGYAHLAFYIVRMYRELLTGLEIEVQNLEIRRIMNQEISESSITKTVFAI
jgi:hypothetical protein